MFPIAQESTDGILKRLKVVRGEKRTCDYSAWLIYWKDTWMVLLPVAA